MPDKSKLSFNSDLDVKELKMLYWLIPYLVAFNASDSGDWKYGPEYHFKAEINSNATLPMVSGHWFTDTTVEYYCRPMNSSFLQCRIDSTKVEKSETSTGSNSKKEARKDKKRVNEFGINNIIFEIDFEKRGIYKVEFLHEIERYRINIINAIIGTMHSGIRLDDKKLQSYDSHEESVIGICDTRFNIRNMWPLEKIEDDKKAINGFKFYVPLLNEKPEDMSSIVIEKIRHLDECSTKTFYLFGSKEDRMNNSKSSETLITYSQSKIFVGDKSFKSFTENLGTVRRSSRGKSDTMEMKVGEKIQINLESIKPAKKELLSISNVENIVAVKSKPLFDASLQG